MRSIGHNKKMRAIHWFRNDLRLGDNPALNAASEEDVLPIFILDTDQTENLGKASKVWLHHSLDKLNQSLGGKLHFIQGDAINEIMKLIDSEKIDVDSLHSRSNWSPFEGWEAIFPYKVFRRGELISENSEVVSKGGGLNLFD